MRRSTSPGLLLLVIALGAAGCTSSGGVSRTPTGAVSEPPPTTSPEGAEALEAELRRTLTLPPMPAFTIPTDLLSTAENQRIADELDLAPGLYQGIAVLDARCTDAGEAAAADLGAAPATGPQTYKDDEVSITVGGDGTGTYDAPGVHVAVLPDGSGVYDDGTTRFSRAADGSGTYRSGEHRVTVNADGTGSWQDGTVRAWIGPDGAGSYEDDAMRLSMNAAGEVFGDGDPAVVEAVRSVLSEGLPLFPPVPRVEAVTPTGEVCGTVIRLDANVLFEFGAADVGSDGEQHLTRVAALLEALGSPRALVQGHTDAIGGEADNLALSERRAEAVRDVLVGLGLPGSSLETSGLGESEPLHDETAADGADDPAARQLNRRVEIVLPDE